LKRAFPYLLSPVLWGVRNRMRRRERGDSLRAALFGGVGILVGAALFAVVFWLSWQLLDYEELGDYLVRLGLSWLFLTFLSFLAFSALVTSLSTFFLSEDMRLLLAAPVPLRRLFYSRFAKTAGQSSWMVATFLLPVVLAVGLARCAPASFYLTAVSAIVPFVLIPVAFGTLVTLVLVNVFPARRARDILMLMGLLFAVALVVLLRVLRPERLLGVQSLPDVAAFFATLQSPVTPLLPSFWAGETLFTGLRGAVDALHLGALWSTALFSLVATRAAYERFFFPGWTKAQEARKARFTRLAGLDRALAALPLRPSTRSMVLKDMKVFLRDTAQWSQLLLLLALALVYVYNFRVLDLDRIPYMSGTIKNAYAFVNLSMAAFVLAAVAVRFVFPAVSAEGASFWVVRSSPLPMSTFLWSKFWSGFVPVVVLAEGLTVASNQLLGVAPALKILTAVAIFGMSLALVGLAAGLGARYPRFGAENITQVAGSFGGVAFMVLAVLFILVVVSLLAFPASTYLWHELRGEAIPRRRLLLALACLAAAVIACGVTLWLPMKKGIDALENLG
jgi:ABC-2 type transport system permease protein